MKELSDTLTKQNQKALDEGALPTLLDETLIQTIESNIDLILLPACYDSRILYRDTANPPLYRHLYEYFQAAFLRRNDAIDNCIDVW